MMKYIALLSGGKDSCFTLLHCHHNGHQLVAAATLSPHSGKDDIDSYMYQTVGHDAVALVAQALDVPLYRRVIRGSPIEQATEYGLRSAGGGGIAGDETEDLYALLSDVLEHHPDVRAVSVGAILSNYQRVRVEHVCRRLSLTPLAYLWQRNQVTLLSEMISSSLHAVLIKISGAGLTPSDLGRPLISMQSKLLSLHQKFGTHPCGEGGEYETFTIDSPLFKSRIVIKDEEVVFVDQSHIAPVAYLRINQALLVKKEITPIANLDIPVPPLLDSPFEALRIHVEESLCHAESDPASGTNSLRSQGQTELGPTVRRIGPWIAVGNVRFPTSRSHSNIGNEVAHCFKVLENLLIENAPTYSTPSELLPASATITLLLPNVDGPTFSSANATYSSYFGASPPARACVGVGGEGVGLDCLAWAGEPNGTPDDQMVGRKMKGEWGARRALHVQSLSYWAPANIGPYSQAISIPPYTFVSGQIGLIPSSLTLPSPSAAPSAPESSTSSSALPLETALVLQHTARIIRAAPNSRLGDGSEGGFGRSDSGSELEADGVSRAGRGEGGWIQLAIYYLAHVTDLEPVRKNVELIDGLTPTLYTVLSSLPRGARVEKQVLVHSGRFFTSDSETSDLEDREYDQLVVDRAPEFVQDDVTVRDPKCPGAEIRFHYEISGFPPSSQACAVVFMRGFDAAVVGRDALVAQAAVRIQTIRDFAPFLERTLTAKAFVTHPSDGCGRLVVPLLEAVFRDKMPALTIVPSRYVASRAGCPWDWAVTLMAV